MLRLRLYSGFTSGEAVLQNNCSYKEIMHFQKEGHSHHWASCLVSGKSPSGFMHEFSRTKAVLLKKGYKWNLTSLCHLMRQKVFFLHLGEVKALTQWMHMTHSVYEKWIKLMENAFYLQLVSPVVYEKYTLFIYTWPIIDSALSFNWWQLQRTYNNLDVVSGWCSHLCAGFRLHRRPAGLNDVLPPDTL